MNFADRLIGLRKGLGLTQEDLADRVGVSRQSVSKWETGESLPDMVELVQLADVLGVSTDVLSGRIPMEKPDGTVPAEFELQKKRSSGQKGAVIASIIAVAVTLAVCLLTMIIKPAWIESPAIQARLHQALRNSFIPVFLVPAACTMFGALMLAKKMPLWMCCLFTLIELSVFGVFRIVDQDLSAGFHTFILNMSDLLTRLMPLWFVAVMIHGVVEKRKMVLLGGILGFLLYPIMMPLAATVFYDSQAAITCLNVECYGSLVIVIALGIHDLVMFSRDKKTSADAAPANKEEVFS